MTLETAVVQLNVVDDLRALLSHEAVTTVVINVFHAGLCSAAFTSAKDEKLEQTAVRALEESTASALLRGDKVYHLLHVEVFHSRPIRKRRPEHYQGCIQRIGYHWNVYELEGSFRLFAHTGENVDCEVKDVCSIFDDESIFTKERRWQLP